MEGQKSNHKIQSAGGEGEQRQHRGHAHALAWQPTAAIRR